MAQYESIYKLNGKFEENYAKSKRFLKCSICGEYPSYISYYREKWWHLYLKPKCTDGCEK